MWFWVGLFQEVLSVVGYNKPINSFSKTNSDHSNSWGDKSTPQPHQNSSPCLFGINYPIYER